MMKRVRKENDGSETVFLPKHSDPKSSYHAEIRVYSVEELRDLKRAGKLIALRMVGTTNEGKRQVNLVPWQEIEDFDWKS
jgi:hypothetical protein